MREVKPVGSKLYVKLLQETKTQSGLVIVRKKQEWQEETLTALVCSTGSTFSYEEIKPGTEIIIAGHAGKWVDPYLTDDSNAIFRMIEQDEIIGYIEEVSDAGESSPHEGSRISEGAVPLSA